MVNELYIKSIQKTKIDNKLNERKRIRNAWINEYLLIEWKLLLRINLKFRIKINLKTNFKL